MISKGRIVGLLIVSMLGTISLLQNAKVGGSQAEKAKNASDLDGTWQLVEAVFGPNQVGENGLKDTKLVVKGNKYTIRGQHINEMCTFEIDRTKKPYKINVARAEPTQVGDKIKFGDPKKYHGNIKIEGEKLELVIVPLGKKLGEDGTIIYRAKRVKN